MLLPYLILLFTLLPVLELYLLIKIGGYIGAFNTVSIVILTGILGAILAKLEGLRVLRQIQEELAQLRMPADTLLEGMFILVGGILLLTPGFITDILGFLFVIPFTRKFFLLFLKKRIKKMVENGETIVIHRF